MNKLFETGIPGTTEASAQRRISKINVMSPTTVQWEAFLALPDSPVVMVNLLKFKSNGGTEEYAKYAAALPPILAAFGARILFSGEALSCVIGAADWDGVALVQYPRPSAILQMTESEEYQAIHHHRANGLEGQVLYAVAAGGTE